jgi:cell division protease FtsH
MTDPDLTPKNDNKPNDNGSRKPVPKSSGRMIFFLVIAGVVFLALYPLLFAQDGIKKLKFSEFEAGLTKGLYNETNVHELLIGVGYISFQDRPRADGEILAEEENRPTIYKIAIATMGDETEARLTGQLRNLGIGYDYVESPEDWQSWTLLLILALPLVLLLVLMIRRIGGAGSALAFGRSKGRMYAEDDTKTTFEEIAGIDEAVEELKEVVEFLQTPGKYQALGGRIPKGVLLVGPPGTGKTLLAKAVAGEAGVPFVSLSGSDFVEMFVGVGAARVRDMFQQAAQRAPCIIFIDELDALGKARGTGMPGGHDEREQTLNALLVEMDGFGSDQSVIVMAATNRPETLDPALLRPGRFDRHVLVDRPDVRGREAILKVHVVKIKMDDTVDLSAIAKLTPGFVGADLANLVNEAALLAARRNLKAVTMAEFEEGAERVVAGLEQQTRIIQEDEKLRVAYHECGHALVACSLPHTDPVHKISIIPRGLGALGYTMHRPEEERHLKTQTELTNLICCLLGGIGAEEIIYQETSTGAQNDLQRATDIARRMVTEFGMSPKLGRVHYSESRSNPFLGGGASAEPIHSADTIREIDMEVKRILDECNQTVVDTLTARKVVLEQMTKELMEVEVMGSDHLKRILDEHHPGAQIMPGTQPKSVANDEAENSNRTTESSDNSEITGG